MVSRTLPRQSGEGLEGTREGARYERCGQRSRPHRLVGGAVGSGTSEGIRSKEKGRLGCVSRCFGRGRGRSAGRGERGREGPAQQARRPGTRPKACPACYSWTIGRAAHGIVAASVAVMKRRHSCRQRHEQLRVGYLIGRQRWVSRQLPNTWPSWRRSVPTGGRCRPARVRLDGAIPAVSHRYCLLQRTKRQRHLRSGVDCRRATRVIGAVPVDIADVVVHAANRKRSAPRSCRHRSRRLPERRHCRAVKSRRRTVLPCRGGRSQPQRRPVAAEPPQQYTTYRGRQKDTHGAECVREARRHDGYSLGHRPTQGRRGRNRRQGHARIGRRTTAAESEQRCGPPTLTPRASPCRYFRRSHLHRGCPGKSPRQLPRRPASRPTFCNSGKLWCRWGTPQGDLLDMQRRAQHPDDTTRAKNADRYSRGAVACAPTAGP